MAEAAQKTMQRPEIGQFVDYRAYLSEMVGFLKATSRRFSYRRFAKTAGFASASFLTLVIQGKRNLSAESIGGFARALGLTQRERETFEAMVLFGQAKTDDERNHYYQRFQRTLGNASATAELGNDQYEVYSLWYAMPIREMMLLPDFREDPTWIARRIYPPIKPREAERALALLERTGLAVRKDGRLQPAEAKLRAIRPLQRLAVRNYHRALLKNAISSLDTLPVESRNVTSLTVGLTDEQYAEVCERIAEFQQELLDQYENENGAAPEREIYALGCQLVPLSRRKS